MDTPEHRRDLLFRVIVDAMQQKGFALVDRLGDEQACRLVFRGKLVEGAGRRNGLVMVSYDSGARRVRASLWRAAPMVPAEAPGYTLAHYYSAAHFEDRSRLAQSLAAAISAWLDRIVGRSY